MKFKWYIPAGSYDVVSTDYETYSIVYSCEEFLGVAKIEYLWILSREIEPLADFYEDLFKIIKSEIPNYDMTKFIKAVQGGGCIYEN